MKNSTKKEVMAVLEAAKELAKMKHPSVEKILRGNGYDFEADKVAELVKAVDECSFP